MSYSHYNMALTVIELNAIYCSPHKNIKVENGCLLSQDSRYFLYVTKDFELRI